jgi:hypothetical protein
MAGVLGQLIRPQKTAMHQKAMELQTAKEILAEVFRVRISEVDEMIQNRFEAAENCCEVAGKNDMVSEGNGLWPQEFWLEG